MMRHTNFLVASITFLSAICFENQAQAQKHLWNVYNPYAIGIGVGFSFGPGSYGPYASPAIGAYPLWYPGYYGNGISMYGPPVPTYAPVPGTFGASDNSVIQNAPMLGVGLGFSFDHPTPPPAVVPPAVAAPARDEPLVLDPKMLGLQIDDKMMIVEVRLPIENAAVFFNDQFTNTKGPLRLFSSPANLKPGQSYQYTVRAEWIIDGQKVSKTLKVTGTPGQRVVADFVKG